MKKIRFYLLPAAGFAVIVGALILTQVQPSRAQTVKPPQDVTVVNTSSQAVPIAGTVGLATGGSVGIDPSSNGIKIVRDEENPARQAFQDEVNLVLPVGQRNQTVAFPVPDGKRLVIEFISIQSRDSEPHRVVVNTKANRTLASYTFFPAATGINTFYTLQQQTRIYADTLSGPGPADGIGLTVLRGADTIQGFFNISISGYLVDIP